MALFNSMSLRGKLTLAAVVVAFLIAVVVILKMATAPSYVTVMTGVDPTKSAEISAALSAAGVDGELVNAGTQLRVPKGSEDKAITALAQSGLNSGETQMGFSETLDKQKLGASNMQQKIAYQRGLEGEIANAIGKIDGVGKANVRLTLPDDTAFIGPEQQTLATAAVVLGADSSALNPGAVRGIANIVASSVPKLNPQKVTITDGTGALVWPLGDGAGDGSSSKAAAEASRAQSTEARLNSLLDQTVGPGRARVKVNYDLNMDKVSREELKYDKKGTPAEQERGRESLTGPGQVPLGTAGVQSNVPTYGGARGTAGRGSNYRQQSSKTRNAIGKRITKTDVATGGVNRLQVGLIVDKNLGLTAADLTNLEDMVRTAAGVVAGRDQITTTQLAFPKEAPADGPVPAGILDLVKAVAIGLAVLLFLFFLSRHLRRRETDELMDEPSWLRQLPRPPEPEIVLPEPDELPAGPPQPHIMTTLATADPRRVALEEIVDHEPERVASHLRSWITEDAS